MNSITVPAQVEKLVWNIFKSQILRKWNKYYKIGQQSGRYPKNKQTTHFLNFITARKWSCEQVMFLHLSVSHSVHGGRSTSSLRQTRPGQTPPGRHRLGRHAPWQVDTPLRHGYCSERYTSYWNAFLSWKWNDNQTHHFLALLIKASPMNTKSTSNHKALKSKHFMQNDDADFPKIISSLLIIMKIRNYQSSSSKMGFYELLL